MITLLMLLLFQSTLIAPEVITVTVTPRVCNEPCTIKLTITAYVPEDSEVCFSIDDASYQRSSCWMKRFNTTEVPIKDVPAGVYTIWAAVEYRVKHDDGTSSMKIERAQTALQVISRHKEKPKGGK